MLWALLMVNVCSLAISHFANDIVEDIYAKPSLIAENADQPQFAELLDVLAVAGFFLALQQLQRKKTKSKDQNAGMQNTSSSPHSRLQPVPHKPANGNKNLQEVSSKDQETKTPKNTPSPRSSLQAPQTPPQDGNKNLQETMRDVVQRGRPDQLKQILDQAYHREVRHTPEKTVAVSVATAHVLCAVKACALRKYYSESLAIYDHCSNRLGQGSADLWSTLLFCASRSEQQVHRCEHFYANLCSLKSPKVKDLLNLSSCFACAHNLDGLRAALDDFVQQDGPLDCTSRNNLMGICAKKGATDLVEELASDRWSVAWDTVTYNTLMACFTKAKRQHECFKVFKEMRHAKAVPDQFTVGILLDCCLQTNPIDIQHMMLILNVLRSEDIAMNHVHYTTLIKGLVQGGLVQNALQVLEQMRNHPSLRPDLVTYSTVVKGLAELGDVDGTLGWLETMTREGVVPDNIFFNIILLGCSNCSMPPTTVKAILAKLLSHGFKPEAGTLSVLIKAFIRSGSWSEAFQVVKDAKLQFDIQPDQRLYLQLAKALSEAHQREWLLKTCTACFEDANSRGEKVPGIMIRKMRWYCHTNQADKAYSRIVALAA